MLGITSLILLAFKVPRIDWAIDVFRGKDLYMGKISQV